MVPHPHRIKFKCLNMTFEAWYELAPVYPSGLTSHSSSILSSHHAETLAWAWLVLPCRCMCRSSVRNAFPYPSFFATLYHQSTLLASPHPSRLITCPGSPDSPGRWSSPNIITPVTIIALFIPYHNHLFAYLYSFSRLGFLGNRVCMFDLWISSHRSVWYVIYT